MISDGIQQGYAFHFRTAGFLFEKLHGVEAGKRRVDDQHIRFVRAKRLHQKFRSGDFDELDAEPWKSSGFYIPPGQAMRHPRIETT